MINRSWVWGFAFGVGTVFVYNRWVKNIPSKKS